MPVGGASGRLRRLRRAVKTTPPRRRGGDLGGSTIPIDKVPNLVYIPFMILIIPKIKEEYPIFRRFWRRLGRVPGVGQAAFVAASCCRAAGPGRRDRARTNAAPCGHWWTKPSRIRGHGSIPRPGEASGGASEVEERFASVGNGQHPVNMRSTPGRHPGQHVGQRQVIHRSSSGQ